MNDDSFFDPLDDELRRRFAAAAPHTPADPDAVLDGLRPQLRRARTRHRAALGGIAAGVVAVVAVAGFALTGGISNPDVTLPPATPAPAPGPDRTTPTMPQPTIPDGASSGDKTAELETQQEQAEADLQEEANRIEELLGAGDTTTTVPAPTQQSYSSSGGSIAVQLSNGQVSLVTATPVANATYEIHDNGPDRVEVRFFDSSDDEISRIRVEVVDGKLVRIA
jgi:hypothetical protein